MVRADGVLRIASMQLVIHVLAAAASAIDVSDDRWHVFGVFCRKAGAVGIKKYHQFIGYATGYVFTNPTRMEQPDALRICQFLVSPICQRRGHGTHLYHAMHQFAKSANMFELTIESPAVGMTHVCCCPLQVLAVVVYLLRNGDVFPVAKRVRHTIGTRIGSV
jgi:GNAT superfamily N-acetyltransferase